MLAPLSLPAAIGYHIAAPHSAGRISFGTWEQRGKGLPQGKGSPAVGGASGLRTAAAFFSALAALRASYHFLNPSRRRLTSQRLGMRAASEGQKQAPEKQRAVPLTASLVIVWLALFCDYVLMTMAIPIFPLLNKPDALIGVLFAAKAMFQILFSPLMVPFVDLHEKSMIIAGLGLETLSVLVFALTFDYSTWFVARAVSGVASAAIVSAGLAHLSRRYADPEQRAIAMGLATTGIIAGVCLGPLLGGTLYQACPSLPFALLAAMQILTGFFAWVRLPAIPARSREDKDSTKVVQMLRNPEVWRPLGALVLANAGISCLESTVTRYMMHTFEFTIGQVGALFLLVSAPACLLSGMAGALGNRIGRATLVQAGLVIQGLFSALGPKHMFGVEVLSLVGIGAGMGAIDGASPSLLGEAAEKHFGGTGKIFVLSNVAVQLGFVVGPVLGSIVAGRFGFSACSVAAGALLLAYAPLVKRRRHSR